jgi:hypothetical protein
MDRALSLKPKLILVATYLGNDLFDAYEMVVNRKQCAELLTTQTSESTQPARVQAAIEPSKLPDDTKVSLNSWPHFFWNHSKLLGLVRPFKDVLHVDHVNYFYQKWIAKNSHFIFYAKDSIQTTFDVLARLPGIDDSRPYVSQGFELTLAAISQMYKRARENQVSFGVVIIPTKESVFSPFFRSHLQKNSDVFQRIVDSEARYEGLLQRFLEENSIHAFFAKAPLQKLVSEGISPYRVSADGHLNRFGQEIIATGIFGWIDQIGK